MTHYMLWKWKEREEQVEVAAKGCCMPPEFWVDQRFPQLHKGSSDANVYYKIQKTSFLSMDAFMMQYKEYVYNGNNPFESM